MALKLCQNLRAYGGSAPWTVPAKGFATGPHHSGPWTPPVIARATRSVDATLTSCPGRQIH